MAVIDPSNPNAGTKKGGRKVREPGFIHYYLLAGRVFGLFYDLADRRRHHAAEVDRRVFSLPTVGGKKH